MTSALLETIVACRQEQGQGVAVLELRSVNGGVLPPFGAGAHIDVHLPSGQVRQYSLCNDPAERSCYRIGVLHDPTSRGGSRAVHEYLHEGVSVQVSAPRNLFPLATGAQRSLLIGGGIGITPMIAMAYELQAQEADFELHYCGRSRGRSAFVEELQAAPFADHVHLHFSDEDNTLDIHDALAQPRREGVHVYTCGPAGFMDWVTGYALHAGYPEAQIHREYFQVEVDTRGASFEVVAARSGKTVTVAQGQSIFTALSEAGIAIDVSCEQGVCGTCLCDVLEGEPDHRDLYFTEEEKAANDAILVCCSRSRSARLVLDI